MKVRISSGEEFEIRPLGTLEHIEVRDYLVRNGLYNALNFILQIVQKGVVDPKIDEEKWLQMSPEETFELYYAIGRLSEEERERVGIV